MHLLFIADGDRRYADKFGLSRHDVYQKAAKLVRSLVEWYLVNENVDEFTFFGLSYNNLIKRNESDLTPIIDVQREALLSFANDSFFAENKIKINIYGQTSLFPSDYLAAIEKVEEVTKGFSNKTFNLLLGYSGQLDFDYAIKETKKHHLALNFENIVSHCQIHQPIDLVVRTANEYRISDGPFFLTQYSEYYSCPKYFPIFNYADVHKSIQTYNCRKRTFGK